MSSREANIEGLNNAIATLSEDAEDLHGLIERSTSELESATAAGNRAADNAGRIIEALTPLTELLEAQHRDSAAMLDEAKKASDAQRVATAEQMESLRGTVGETLESVSTKTETMCSELRKTVEDSFGELGKIQDGAFDELKTKTLKEHERTRDELQTDMLGFKNATSSRLDSLESEVTKAEGAIKEIEGKIEEGVDSVKKKLLIPIYTAIGLGVVNLVCLVMLLIK